MEFAPFNIVGSYAATIRVILPGRSLENAHAQLQGCATGFDHAGLG